MRHLLRALRFVARYAAHPAYILAYLANYKKKGFALNAAICDESEVAAQIRRGRSIIRFGDGEINLLLGLKNHYHAYTPTLRDMLAEIVETYNDDKPYLLAIPKFVNYRNTELRGIGKLNVWMPFKTIFVLMFPKRARYMDAHSFYYDGYFERLVAPAISEKSIVLVTNQVTINKQRQNLRFPWRDFQSVVTPDEEALPAFGRIRKEVLEVLGGMEKPVTLVSMGPAGKYLVKELAERGYQAIDIGKAAEVIFTGESIEWMI